MRVLHEESMKVIAVRLPKALNTRLEGQAKRDRKSKSALIRQVLESHLGTRKGRKRLTTLNMVGHLIGSLKGGPPDLSSNPKHLEGFGR
jgi:metal-responsive CopG/Arc/MetJ family transcriptional regulator